MALPFLPGNSFNKNLGKERFHRSQHFVYKNKLSVFLDEDKPGIGGDALPGQKHKPKFSVFPEGIGSTAPSWVAFDKQILVFEAYFREDICQRPNEPFRIRPCKIYFYLEDDTIKVVEKQKRNSGISDRTLIRRHRIALPPPHDDQFYTVDQFNINKDIVFYSRTYRIVNCDEFTKNFLRKLGVRVNPPDSVPHDPYFTMRKEMDEMKPRRPYEPVDTLSQFLEHDRKVLRFYCLWDDTPFLFGEKRELVLHYFLGDDTIEILEILPPNSGRDSVPLFLHRGILPKSVPSRMYNPGEITARTVLNVFGPIGDGGRFILDNRKSGVVTQDSYKDYDLTIGAAINAWGRTIILCDCDEFTKNYYRTKYGVEDFTPIQYKAPKPPAFERKFPPYTGFGSEEDSLCSCLGLLSKPPQRDFKKFIEKDRRGLESNVLRFVAKMISGNPINLERKLILSYFLCDDTIAIFEPPLRNSGVVGGTFMERGRVKKPGQELFKSEMSEYFTAQDLFVGARVAFNGRTYILVDADEYVFSYMEKHKHEFPMSDISAILRKLRKIGESKPRDINQAFAANDPGHRSEMTYETFRNVMVKITEGKLTEHEIMTVGRYYSVREKIEVDLDLLIAVAQEQLKKKRFENFSKLTDAFVYNDRERKGLLPFEETRIICKAFKIPLADDILRILLEQHEESEGEINYGKFVSAIDWRENPVPARQTPPIKFDADWNGQDTGSAVMNVKYMLLLEDLFGK